MKNKMQKSNSPDRDPASSNSPSKLSKRKDESPEVTDRGNSVTRTKTKKKKIARNSDDEELSDVVKDYEPPVKKKVS